MLHLGDMGTDEPEWNMIEEPITFLDKDDWDNELPTLIYQSYGVHCGD